jgi:hypothetical protein
VDSLIEPAKIAGEWHRERVAQRRGGCALRIVWCRDFVVGNAGDQDRDHVRGRMMAQEHFDLAVDEAAWPLFRRAHDDQLARDAFRWRSIAAWYSFPVMSLVSRKMSRGRCGTSRAWGGLKRSRAGPWRRGKCRVVPRVTDERIVQLCKRPALRLTRAQRKVPVAMCRCAELRRHDTASRGSPDMSRTRARHPITPGGPGEIEFTIHCLTPTARYRANTSEIGVTAIRSAEMFSLSAPIMRSSSRSAAGFSPS